MAQRLLLSLFLILLAQPLLADSLVVVPIGDSPALGPANAPVTIIEFVDFQ